MTQFDSLPELYREAYICKVKEFVYEKCQGNRALVINKINEGIPLVRQGKIPAFVLDLLRLEIAYEVEPIGR